MPSGEIVQSSLLLDRLFVLILDHLQLGFYYRIECEHFVLSWTAAMSPEQILSFEY